jgi:hypothetical protein
VGGSHLASNVNRPDYNPSVSGFNFEADAPKLIGNAVSPRYNADPYTTLDPNKDSYDAGLTSRYSPTVSAATPKGTTFNAGINSGRYTIDPTKAATAGKKADGTFNFDEAI